MPNKGGENMPELGSKRSVRIPKGLHDDWKQTDLYISFCGNTICLTKEEKFPEGFNLIGISYLDSKMLISLPIESLSILGVKGYGDVVVVFKKSDDDTALYIQNPSIGMGAERT